MLTRRTFTTLAASSLTGLASGGAIAQTAAPRPINMIVPFEAGSAPDVYARLIAEAMRRSMGRSFVVENKLGAAGNVGTSALAREPADGNSILVGSMALCEINPLVFDNMRWSMKDFTPIIKGIGAPLVLVVHPSVPARSLEELVSWAKTKTGSLSYASYGAGTPSHFLGEQLSKTFNLDLAHVPYRGSISQVSEILAGHSLMGFAQTQNSLDHLRSGGLRAIAITSNQRYRLLLDIPTFEDVGHPKFATAVWFGLLVRAGGPADFLDAVTAAAIAAHADPQVRETLMPQGYDMIGQVGADFAKAIEDGAARWAVAVKATGFKASQ